MSDLFPDALSHRPPPDVLPGRKLSARIKGVYLVPEGSRVESVAVEALNLQLEGPVGDRHHGFARKSTSREPWYERGSVISNTRQLSLLSVEELAEVARRMNLAELRPEWIGGNILIEGVANLSFLPLGTRLHFPGGAALMVSEQNGPCRIAGKAIAAHFPDRPELEFEFPIQAKRKRGLLASVEHAGVALVGETISIRVPEQRIYRG